MAVTRRHLFESAVTLAAAAVAVSTGARGGKSRSGPETVAAGSPTVSKQDASYQDQPNGQQRCAQCKHFVAPSSCQVVIGTVVPNGWCRLFAPNSS